MDFMKVFDQTVREIKREVNLKVLKVPEIEQKVLDATDNEPWGPHGTALAEIAQATKKFTEFQLVMNVLWTRLSETGKDWRYVYKALTVIEYLISHGSERAVDDIIEHTFRISSLTSFEYVEPNGKDMGINVRKKAETIVGILSDKEKIQQARNKAAANRDKYVGLSSTGITYKSNASSYSSGDSYGGLSSKREGDSYRDSYKESSRYGEEKFDSDTYVKSHRGAASESQGNSSKESRRYGSKDSKKKFSSKLSDSDKHSQSTNTPSNNCDDDFDDFDPRGTSSSKLEAGSSDQVDLFGPNLIDDLFDGPASVPTQESAMNTGSTDVDLFADVTFVSAPTKVAQESSPQAQQQVDLFASQPAVTPAASPSVDLFAASDPVVQPDIKGQVDLFASQSTITPAASPTIDFFSTTDPVVQPAVAANIEPVTANIIDPFAAVPLNNFDGSDIFGSFTTHSDSASKESKQSLMNDGNLNNVSTKSSQDSKASQKKDAFQVKSGIWADSLSRGIIDLNISAPKKVSLADVGIVGGLSDVDEREKRPPTSFYNGRAMGTGSGLGKTGFGSTTLEAGEDDLFSSLGSHQHSQFSNFKK